MTVTSSEAVFETVFEKAVPFLDPDGDTIGHVVKLVAFSETPTMETFGMLMSTWTVTSYYRLHFDDESYIDLQAVTMTTNADGSLKSLHIFAEDVILDASPPQKMSSSHSLAYELKNMLGPGMDVDVDCPLGSKCDRVDENSNEYNNSIFWMIQHLNDSENWSREQIADWLETLDVDLTFKIGEDNDID